MTPPPSGPTLAQVAQHVQRVAQADVDDAFAAARLTDGANSTVRLRRIDMTPGVRTTVADQLHERLLDLDRREIIEYEPEMQFDNDRAGLFPLAEVPAARRIVELTQAPADLNPLDDIPRSTLKSIVIWADVDTTAESVRVVAGRGAVRRWVPDRDKVVLATLGPEGAFSAIEEQALGFEVAYDFVIVGQAVLVVSHQAMEFGLSYASLVAQQAQDVFDTHITNIGVVNHAALKELCVGDTRLARKASSIARKFEDATYAAAMTATKVAAFLTSHPEVDAPTEQVNGQVRLAFDVDDRHSAWRVLRVLDDDYLTSEITDQTYEAGSKSTP